MISHSAAAHAGGDACPKTLDELKTWRDKQVSAVATRSAVNPLHKRIEACAKESPALFASAEARACLAPLKRFARAHWVRDGFWSGYKISDRDFVEGKGLDFPEMMSIPPQLLEMNGYFAKKLASPLTAEEAIREIEERNKSLPPANRWKAVRFISDGQESADAAMTFGRVLVMIPDEKFDRWVSFSVPTESEKEKWPEADNVSMVSVQKLGKDGRPLSAPIVRLQDFFAFRGDPVHFRIVRNLDDKADKAAARKSMPENCYRCHKSGVIPIHPAAEETLPASARNTLRELNDRISDYGATSWGDAVDTEGYGGPAFGPVDRVRSNEFLGRWSRGTGVTPASYERLRKAMGCAECHNGKTRGQLNYPFGAEKTFLEKHILKDRRMPPHPKSLTDSERLALVQCLRSEYYGGLEGYAEREPGIFKSWLTQPDCVACVTPTAGAPDTPPGTAAIKEVTDSIDGKSGTTAPPQCLPESGKDAGTELKKDVPHPGGGTRDGKSSRSGGAR